MKSFIILYLPLKIGIISIVGGINKLKVRKPKFWLINITGFFILTCHLDTLLITFHLCRTLQNWGRNEGWPVQEEGGVSILVLWLVSFLLLFCLVLVLLHFFAPCLSFVCACACESELEWCFEPILLSWVSNRSKYVFSFQIFYTSLERGGQRRYSCTTSMFLIHL